MVLSIIYNKHLFHVSAKLTLREKLEPPREMMSKTIKVGDVPAKLSNQEGYEILLQRKNIQCLKDPNGVEIYAFVDLVDGMAYTAGPRREQAEVKGRKNRLWRIHVDCSFQIERGQWLHSR